jgi:AraC family transcriptional regulator, positive regulator of tynA and feaB
MWSGYSRVCAQQRADSFKESCGAYFRGLDLAILDPAFRGGVDQRPVGNCAINRVNAPQVHGIYSPAEGGTSLTNCYKFVWQIAGSALIEQDGRTIAMSAGDVGIVQLGLPYRLVTGETYEVLTFSCDLGQQPVWKTIARQEFTRVRRVDAPLRTAAHSLIGLTLAEPEAGEENVLAAIFMLIFASLEQGIAENLDLPHLPSLRLKKALRLVLGNIGDAQLSPDWLASELGISRRLLYLEFEKIGSSPKAFMRDLRLKLCHRCLMTTSPSETDLTRIALEHGFTDSSHFSRAFKSRFGVQPSQVRYH